ncbi:MAG: HNH endonuclease domain-containing protein [Chitinophagales bacterium]|nr:HNH endonuclease domain-containing protein [Chitinophagales bacterium]
MKNILGLDLGTNSIGWAIRNLDSITENQITSSGAVIFQKGVGEGKSGEFSLSAERRTHRSKRRLYNAKRYRKWSTLKVLIDNKMCPLTIEELERWTKYKKEDGGRNYPTSPEFMEWVRMDFDVDGKLDYINPYELRCELLESYNEKDKNRLHKIGRAFYHLVQRRGFKSSRKSGKSGYANNEELEKLKEANPEIQISQVLLNKLNTENKRIRASGVIQRKYFEDEFNAICKAQKIDGALAERLHKAIYFVRPLRTQKGLVGKCTLEKGKSRIPISHPLFEEFRALQFVNNLKWRKAESKDLYEQVPVSVRKEIFKKQFFKISAPHFKFEEIIQEFSNDGEYEFNYRNKPNVSACPVISRLKAVLKDEWTNPFIEDKDEIGINWSGLSIAYSVKYGKKKGKERKLDFEDIWHLLFDYLQTKDKEEELKKFMMEVVGWNDEKKAKAFSEIDMQQGYGSLSKTAITKILPYLKKGYIYSEAVSFANLKNVLGEKSFEENKEKATKAISETIAQIDTKKEKLNIINGLIQKYFGELQTTKAKGLDEVIKKEAEKDVADKLKYYFGEKNWNDFPEPKQKEYYDFILKKYLAFLDGKQPPDEKAASRQGKNPEIDYYKLPRLDEAIKDVLKQKFDATDEKLKKLYHPSDIEIYPTAEEVEFIDEETGEVRKCKQLGDPMPPSKAWKNPMAMRTMHELKKMVNYLLETGQIDEETKIVVEMARELNDANKRWAIQTHQRKREEQNIEFAKAILGLAKEKYPNLNENDADNIDKIRLWWEQLDNGDEIYKQVKALKEDVQKYRLWREQECRCMYTGKMINLVDLFDGTKTDFEHTLPISSSFDNSLANLTVCDSEYNRKIKIDRIPYDCPNYANENKGYSPIKSRLKNWIEKVETLKERIEENKFRTKKTQDIATKDDYIQKRHLLQFEFDYWNKKVKTFTVEEVPNWWKNSQLVDTQIISKYARAYLKSLFRKVEVQKGSITAEFRKIYGIMGDEKKDRSKHSHHAIDAAVLTLIPGSARREAILKEYYEALERKQKYHQLPYEDFHVNHVKDIENKILINHVKKDQTLADTKKRARKRGKIVYLRDKKTREYLKDKDGKKIPMLLQGDNIRGRLHKETFFGAVKAVERDNNGYALKDENGDYRIKQVNGEDEIWIVARKLITDIDIDKDIIVDEVLKRHIKEQLQNGKKPHEVVDFNGKIIRHIRCRVKAGRGVLSKDKALPIKKHAAAFLSKHPHKQEYLTQNEENYLFLLYEGVDKKNKPTRGYKILNLFDITLLGITDIEQLKNESEFQKLKKGKEKNQIELKLKAILKVGDKVIFYKENREEITKENVGNRTYRIYKFNEMTTTGYLYCQFHSEARPDNELGDGDTMFNPEKYQARLKLRPDEFNCLVEGKHFEIKPDGKIDWRDNQPLQ